MRLSRMGKVTPALIGAIALLLGCTDRREAENQRRAQAAKKAYLDNLKPLLAGVRNAEELLLYEGLPHQESEATKLKVELETKATIQLHGFPFYQKPLDLSENDARLLTEILLASETLEKGTIKLCGEFHPDYCLVWRSGEKTFCMLICFGCHEIKFYGPKNRVDADLWNEPYDRVKTILSKYRKHRPV